MQREKKRSRNIQNRVSLQKGFYLLVGFLCLNPSSLSLHNINIMLYYEVKSLTVFLNLKYVFIDLADPN